MRLRQGSEALFALLLEIPDPEALGERREGNPERPLVRLWRRHVFRFHDQALGHHQRRTRSLQNAG